MQDTFTSPQTPLHPMDGEGRGEAGVKYERLLFIHRSVVIARVL